MPIPYGLIKKGTIISLGKPPHYTSLSWDLHCECLHDFTYKEGRHSFPGSHFKVVHDPNGWGSSTVFLVEFIEEFNIVSAPIDATMLNEELSSLLLHNTD